MTAKIRGPATDQEQMILGQLRKIFQPAWIQTFENGKILVEFTEEPDSGDELKRFADMYGYELEKEEYVSWYHYTFSQ